MYMRDIRQDEMELSVEDLDVLLDSWVQLEDLVLGRELPRDLGAVIDSVEPKPAVSIHDVISAPEFRDSGLLVESCETEVRITLPPMDDSRMTAKVLADISELWQLTPEKLSWAVELGRLERVPVSLLSRLVELNRNAAERHRIVQLRGLDYIHSTRLTDCLQRCFDLSD